MSIRLQQDIVELQRQVAKLTEEVAALQRLLAAMARRAPNRKDDDDRSAAQVPRA